MTAVVVAILSMTVLGLAIALSLDPRLPGPMLLGLAFLYGSGSVFLVLLVLSILHVRWTIVIVTIVWLAALIALAVTRRQPTTDNRQLKFHWLDILTLISMIGFALFATAAPLWEWDFWAIW